MRKDDHDHEPLPELFPHWRDRMSDDVEASVSHADIGTDSTETRGSYPRATIYELPESLRHQTDDRLLHEIIKNIHELASRRELSNITLLNDTITPEYIRSARAMLGWSISDISERSGLSISTIKRVEGEAHCVKEQSYQLVINTLRTGGIRFFKLNDGTIALAKARRYSL
ncbi:helix-turn-helix domain-containing protein [Methylobacterium marchantiae]|uniref:Multiprotein-bridging factor 1 family protein n=1 Tax=Methylobacterium marchantiae TaxID=600331 RepID=A0ABW3WT47_9HYPH|nr:hypothetical protein AIGOOFII_3518 [Methylobacterium marchantiae]